MPPGPVFLVEMLTTARRRMFYALRASFAVLLLAILGQFYLEWVGPRGEMTTRQATSFAWACFGTLAAAQAFVVLFLTPGLVAGTIAGEKERKTLHYVLASRLSSGEVVVGKLAARLLHVLAFLLTSLPVVSLLSLLGGVDPRLILASYLAIVTTAFFVGSLSMLVSVQARRVRDALGLAYGLTFAWLGIPWMVRSFMSWTWPWLYGWIEPVNDWVVASNPLTFVRVSVLRGGGTMWVEMYAWMVGLQVVYGAILLALAVWGLRPIFRGQEGRGIRRFALTNWKWRVWRRPPVGDDPMLWKEMQTSRTTGAAKAVAYLLGFALLSSLGYATIDFAWPAFRELLGSGYGAGGTKREEFNSFLKIVGAGLGIMLTLGVATLASTSLTSEREQDTWTSLLVTPLDGREILRAKMIGSVWQLRWVVYVMLPLWGLGLATGSVHPLGVVLVAVELAVFVAFSAALGTFFSLVGRTTWRAQLGTMSTMIFINGGYLVFFCPVFFDVPAVIYFGVTPMLQGLSLVDYAGISELWSEAGTYTPSGRRLYFGPAIILGIVVYSAGAIALTLAAVARFDAAVDRPRSPDNSAA